MKIAILTSSFLPKVGGAQVFAYNIARQLVASGNSVHVYVPAENYEALDPQFRDLLKPLPRKFYGVVRRIPVLGLRWAQRFLLRRQKKERYDVWLVIVTYPSGYVATCLKGVVPIVLRASGEDIQKSAELAYGLRLDPAEEARISRTLRSYDRLAALTESVRTDYLELGMPDEAIEIIPNGVDLEWFAPVRDTPEIRKDLGWPADRAVLDKALRAAASNSDWLAPVVRVTGSNLLVLCGRDGSVALANIGPDNETAWITTSNGMPTPALDDLVSQRRFDRPDQGVVCQGWQVRVLRPSGR